MRSSGLRITWAALNRISVWAVVLEAGKGVEEQEGLVWRPPA